MDIFGIGICALCAVLLASLLQKSNKEYALLLSLITAVIFLSVILEQARPLFQQVEEMAGALEREPVRLLLQAVGITVVGQVVSRLCKDGGESALAYTVELAARAAVLVACLPAVGSVLECLEEIAGL